MRRLINLLTALAVVTVATAPFGALAQVRCGRAYDGNWVVFEGPRFSQGGQAITHFAVDPLVPKRAFVTNGTQVMRTLDGMCDWDVVFDTTEEASLQAPAGGDSVVKS